MSPTCAGVTRGFFPPAYTDFQVESGGVAPRVRGMYADELGRLKYARGRG